MYRTNKDEWDANNIKIEWMVNITDVLYPIRFFIILIVEWEKKKKDFDCGMGKKKNN